jgi:hypothetical protein
MKFPSLSKVRADLARLNVVGWDVNSKGLHFVCVGFGVENNRGRILFLQVDADVQVRKIARDV